MTLSWPRLTWPAWDARQAGPRWRKMSATSTAGRDNGRAQPGICSSRSSGLVTSPIALTATRVLERGRVELLVPEQDLDDPDIGLLLQQMGGEAMPQCMNPNTLGDAGSCRCQADQPVQLAWAHVLPAVAGKQPGLTGTHPSLLASDAPPFAQ